MLRARPRGSGRLAVALTYSFFSRSVALGEDGEKEWRLNWIAIDPPGASPVTRLVSDKRMGELELRFGVLSPITLFTEAEIDYLLNPN